MGFLRKKKWIALFLVLVLCAAAVVVYLNVPLTKSEAKTAESTVKVTKGSIRSTVSGTSQFASAEVQTISAPAGGTIKTMNLVKNKEVKKGDVLFSLSNPSLEVALQEAQMNLQQAEKDVTTLQDQAGHMNITAPASGLLTLAGNVDEGSNVNVDGKVGTISDNSKFLVTLSFTAEQANQMKAGDVIDLTIENYSLTKTANVLSVSRQLKADLNGNKVLDVKLSVPNDGSLTAGTKVTGSTEISGLTVESTGEGTLEYTSVTPILSKAQGAIEVLKYKTGDQVQAGESLASLTNDSLQDNILSRQATVDRQKILVDNAQTAVDELQVTAPFDGVFSTDFVNSKSDILADYKVGAKIESGTQLGAVANLDTMQLIIQADELDLTSIKVGQKAEVTVDALTGRPLEAEVTQVATVGTTSNGVTTYDVVLTLQNAAKSGIKSGMTATAEIVISEKKDILILPTDAVQRQLRERYVTLKKADGTIEEKHTVEIGINSSTSVEIVSGLSEGDEVVIPQSDSTKTKAVTTEDIQKIRQQFEEQGGFGGGQGGFPGGDFGGGQGGSGTRSSSGSSGTRSSSGGSSGGGGGFGGPPGN
ncbi:efflux RND transporter periplasmic adaptor subunit [Gorillibacterium massiliense]|uniref:efflux RND transporter periplasmic adaptor subunit n=1 Tax=Gorillibacterium massiliense TaxID=1280390 RepID=UPI0004B5809B|nr:efflux RND transporter periplasmic adaptor subunit [Gorillibacterium massiliense]